MTNNVSLWFINHKLSQFEDELRHMNFQIYKLEKSIDKLKVVRDQLTPKEKPMFQEVMEDTLTQYLKKPVGLDRTEFLRKVYNHTKKINIAEKSN